ncbi:MAG: extracellular solute-binding protein [Xenococcus sp. MO_188.B8]|nr:extracellular solute-binding protein [Xenococcus sp. MO_188.B8]
MYPRLHHILILAIALLLSGCQNIPSEANEQVQEGRLLIWHPFEGQEAATLDSMLDQYRALYPKIKIVDEFFPVKELNENFSLRARSGLGPDLMISSYVDMVPLIRAGILKKLDEFNLDLSIYLPRPIRQVTFNNNLYGLPFVLNTQVLCYNQIKVEQPLKNLPEMISEVEDGRQIAVTSNFLDTLWGMQIFRSQSTINEEYRLDNLFDAQAWGKWLAWLRYAQKNPNFILADKNSTLDQAFAEGKLAYYVCHSEEISNLKATLGQDKLGVTILPGAGNRTAGPLLYTKAIVFNQISSTSTTKLALQLASFLTNAEQQTKLALETESLIPANRKVKLDQRLSPIQAVLFAQSKTAVAVSLQYVYEFDDADEKYGEFYYNLVMAGEMKPQKAAVEFSEKIFEVRQEVRQEDVVESGED